MTEEPPLLQIVRGEPAAEETAVLVVVLLGRADQVAAPWTPPPSAWMDHSRAVRRTLPHGRGAWRASALPR